LFTASGFTNFLHRPYLPPVAVFILHAPSML